MCIRDRKRTALVELHRMLRDGEVEKVYMAVVKGAPAQESFEMREALQKHVTASGERRVSVQEDGKAALTRVKVLRRGKFSLLEVRLLTGRTHQIRVHLAHAGHPIVGDDKYGDFALNKTMKKRLLLHAARLSFRHPLSGEQLKLQSPLPEEFAA